MSEMQFNTEEENEFGRPKQVSDGTSFSDRIVSWGLASNRQQADYLMIGFVILLVVIAFFLYRGLTGDSGVPTEPVYSNTQV